MDLHPGETVLFEGHPSWRSILGFYLLGDAITVVAVVIAYLAGGWAVALAVLVVVQIIVVGVGLLRRIGTRYVITSERLWIRRGVFARRVQQTRIDRVQNVNTAQSFLERVLQVGTVDFDTAGTDDADFVFRGVDDPEDVVDVVDRAQRGAIA
jgi:uncharacterized membrane protein YdbT with pleckstrin-like domain